MPEMTCTYLPLIIFQLSFLFLFLAVYQYCKLNRDELEIDETGNNRYIHAYICIHAM